MHSSTSSLIGPRVKQSTPPCAIFPSSPLGRFAGARQSRMHRFCDCASRLGDGLRFWSRARNRLNLDACKEAVATPLVQRPPSNTRWTQRPLPEPEVVGQANPLSSSRLSPLPAIAAGQRCSCAMRSNVLLDPGWSPEGRMQGAWSRPL